MTSTTLSDMLFALFKHDFVVLLRGRARGSMALEGLAFERRFERGSLNAKVSIATTICIRPFHSCVVVLLTAFATLLTFYLRGFALVLLCWRGEGQWSIWR